MQVCQALCRSCSLVAILDFLKNLTWPITQLCLPAAWSNLNGTTCTLVLWFGSHLRFCENTQGSLVLIPLSVEFVYICCGPSHGLPKYIAFVVLHPDLHLQMSVLIYTFSACWVTLPPSHKCNIGWLADSTWKFSQFSEMAKKSSAWTTQDFLGDSTM